MAALDDESLLMEEEKLQHNSSTEQLFNSTWFLCGVFSYRTWFVHLINLWKRAVHVCEVKLLILVHRQLKVLKDKISDLSKTNYELEREVRFFDQRIGLLINHKKAVEVSHRN